MSKYAKTEYELIRVLKQAEVKQASEAYGPSDPMYGVGQYIEQIRAIAKKLIASGNTKDLDQLEDRLAAVVRGWRI